MCLRLLFDTSDFQKNKLTKSGTFWIVENSFGLFNSILTYTLANIKKKRYKYKMLAYISANLREERV